MIKNHKVFIQHIMNSITDIKSFTKGVTESSFYSNKEKQSAVVRQLEIIGEAVKKLTARIHR